MDQLIMLNNARADADAAFLQTTQKGRDDYRLRLNASIDAEAKWLLDPLNEDAENAAADAFTALEDARAALVKSIGGAKAARTKRLSDAWDAAVKARGKS